jgi:hypothetical protein
MTSFELNIPPHIAAALTDMRRTARDVEAIVREAGEQLEADLKAKEEAKKQRSPIDEMEDKVMASTAVAAAAAGSPEQAREMLQKARAKAMQAAANGADTGALEAMVRQMERLAKIAEERRDLKNHGRTFGPGAEDAVPALVTVPAATV